jgi:hypothetical protein
MLFCMRTTLNLEDQLLRDVKRLAIEQNTTMTSVIEGALREALARRARPGAPYKFRWVTVKGRLRPGVDVNDRDNLVDVMEGRA